MYGVAIGLKCILGGYKDKPTHTRHDYLKAIHFSCMFSVVVAASRRYNCFSFVALCCFSCLFVSLFLASTQRNRNTCVYEMQYRENMKLKVDDNECENQAVKRPAQRPCIVGLRDA